MVFYLYYRHSRRGGGRSCRGTGLSVCSLRVVYMFLKMLWGIITIYIVVCYFIYIVLIKCWLHTNVVIGLM